MGRGEGEHVRKNFYHKHIDFKLCPFINKHAYFKILQIFKASEIISGGKTGAILLRVS